MITNIHKNRVGTLSFDMKGEGMRKSQEFVVYPGIDENNTIKIQSNTRIGKLDITNGTILMSQSHSGGAYFLHLSMDKLNKYTVEGWKDLVLALEEKETMKSNSCVVLG